MLNTVIFVNLENSKVVKYLLILSQVCSVFNVAISASESENITFATTSFLYNFFAIKSSVLFLAVPKFEKNELIFNDVVEKIMSKSKFIIQLEDAQNIATLNHFRKYLGK